VSVSVTVSVTATDPARWTGPRSDGVAGPRAIA